jgi:hypothetical protein
VKVQSLATKRLQELSATPEIARPEILPESGLIWAAGQPPISLQLDRFFCAMQAKNRETLDVNPDMGRLRFAAHALVERPGPNVLVASGHGGCYASKNMP